MNFTEKELIIFDFDGTLINSIPDLTFAINKMLNHYSLPHLTVREVTPFIGNGAKPLVQRALEYAKPNQSISNELLEEAFAIYFSAYQKTTCEETYLYPGVLETLKYLHEKGYQLSLIHI